MVFQQPPPHLSVRSRSHIALVKPLPDLIKHRVKPLTRAMFARDLKNRLGWHELTNHQRCDGRLHGIDNMNAVHFSRRRGQA